MCRIVRPEDVPHNINTLLSLIGFGRDDEPLLSPRKVAYVGEPILGVIAETERQARDAVAAVRVDWEVLPHVLDVEEALRPGAPSVNEEYPNNSFDYHERYDHQKLRFGDVERAFAEADQIVEGEYRMSPIEQAPVETGGATAAPETDDHDVCNTCTQTLLFSLGTTSKLLEMPSSRLHFVGGTVGGGCGGKVDSHREPLAVLDAHLTGRPVKHMWDRVEEMQVGAPRGAELWRIKDGVMNDGRIVARQFTGFFDSGAYTRLSSYAVIKCTGHLPGPYTIPSVASNVYCVYTNRTPSTAMRGFGITGVDFAIECQMDRVTEAVGKNPVELRILNAYRDGDMKAHRRLAKNCALIECCQVAAEKAGWAIRPEFAHDSNLAGGGGARAEIPETATNQAGQIGERRQREIPTEPFGCATSRGRIPVGTSGRADVAVPPQDADMVIDPARAGYRGAAAPRSPAPSQPAVQPPLPAAPAYQQPTAQPPAHVQPPAAPPPQAPAPVAPPQATPPQPEPYQPAQPFQRGLSGPASRVSYPAPGGAELWRFTRDADFPASTTRSG